MTIPPLNPEVTRALYSGWVAYAVLQNFSYLR